MWNDTLTILDGSNIVATVGVKDILTWGGNSSIPFSFNSLYKLANPQIGIENSAFGFIWGNSALYKIQCFIWLVHLGIKLLIIS